MSKRLAIIGAAGRMGKAVQQLAEQQDRFDIAARLELQSQTTLLKAAHVDVVIDFSTPAATLHWLPSIIELKLPIVIGTTGFSQAEFAQLQAAAQRIALFYAANMSVGMHLFIQAAAQLAQQLDASYAIDIVETHHQHKKDAPSGSAKTLGDAVIAAKKLTPRGYPMMEQVARPQDGYPLFQSRRQGEVVGEHQISFSSHFETLSLQHQAHDRALFAQGALHVAAWLLNQPPGYYTMTDFVKGKLHVNKP